MMRSAIAGLALLAACQSQPDMYAWGSYEMSVYNLCSAPDAFELDAEIEALQILVEGAANDGRLVAPGVHAHLGYLLSLRGDVDDAAAAFESEKELFPESSVFVDGVLARLKESTGGGR